jgi:hypothetical protein
MSCKRSASWFCLVWRGKLTRFVPGPRARPRLRDLERRAIDRVGKSAPMDRRQASHSFQAADGALVDESSGGRVRASTKPGRVQ